MSRRSTKYLCSSALIGALYAALTLLVPPLSYGAVQCRLSEAMALLPMALPQAVPGLFIGCLAANLLSPVGVWDVVFGSLATLIGAAGTRMMRRWPLAAAVCPVAANSVIVGAVLARVYALPPLLTMGQVALGEALAVAAGFALMRALRGKIDWKKLQ